MMHFLKWFLDLLSSIQIFPFEAIKIFYLPLLIYFITKNDGKFFIFVIVMFQMGKAKTENIRKEK